MTANEVVTTLFWIVAGSYVFYLGWSIRRAVAYRTSRSHHPVNGDQRSV
jgi:threonine/homoserine/homoserine lactone efflux protein